MCHWTWCVTPSVVFFRGVYSWSPTTRYVSTWRVWATCPWGSSMKESRLRLKSCWTTLCWARKQAQSISKWNTSEVSAASVTSQLTFQPEAECFIFDRFLSLEINGLNRSCHPPTEYSRYLHSHLDIPVAEYNVDQDLPGNFKNHWAKNLPFLIEDYEEQPGLQPHIKWVLRDRTWYWLNAVQYLLPALQYRLTDRLWSRLIYCSWHGPTECLCYSTHL